MQQNHIIKKKIIVFYKKKKRDLPWRKKLGEKQEPYKTLISEFMLQQTRVDTAINYYRKFINKWPDLKSLSRSKLSEVLTVWAGLGYYRRAINLHKAAKIIMKNYNGVIPDTKEELKKLPGIGEYTSSAILGFAFGKSSIIIDTNIRRFISRINGVEDNILLEKQVTLLAKKLFPKKNTGDFAQAIMDFASAYCKKRNPVCSECIIKKECNFSDIKMLSNNENKNKEKKKKYSFVFLLVDKKNHFFIKKRPLDKILGGLYEVPGTDWTTSTWPNKNNLKKKNITFNSWIEKKEIIKHEFSHFNLFTKVFIKKIKKENKDADGVWINKKDMNKLPLSKLTYKIINASLK